MKEDDVNGHIKVNMKIMFRSAYVYNVYICILYYSYLFLYYIIFFIFLLCSKIEPILSTPLKDAYHQSWCFFLRFSRYIVLTDMSSDYY